MTVVAQPTQGDSDTNVDDNASERKLQTQDSNSSNQTDCEHPEDISRTNLSMTQNVCSPPKLQ